MAGRLGCLLMVVVGVAAWRAPQARADIFIVTTNGEGGDGNLNDGVCNRGDGECSLRAAIEQANNNADADEILFDIGSGPATIQLTSALPAITATVTIDGTTQPGFAGTPVVGVKGQPSGSDEGIVVHANNCTIKGLVLSGFGSSGFGASGILIENSQGARVEGNFIGVNRAGTAASPNGTGISIIDSPRNKIGGNTPQKRNVISGNVFFGVYIQGVSASSNGIEGNYIGTDVTGLQAIGNGIDGVNIFGAPLNYVGGLNPNVRNIISGNARGVDIHGTESKINIVSGNYIGADVNGDLLGNSQVGVLITATIGPFDNPASSTLVGGPMPGAGNLIVGNGIGVLIKYGATINRIEGNRILDSVDCGIKIEGSPGNTIGGQDPDNACTSGYCNVIAGTGGHGVLITGVDSSANWVQGNVIGPDPAGGTPGNSGAGVLIQDASESIIGASSTEASPPQYANFISHNQFGVVVAGAAAQRNTIRANSIHHNLFMGIDLGGDGNTANDNVLNFGGAPNYADADADVGPNGLLNFPVGVTAEYRPDVNTTTISGVVSTAQLAGVMVDIYANERVDDSDIYQAQLYLGSAVTGPTGVFQFDYAGPLPAGFVFLTATATLDKATSELTVNVCRDMPGGDPMPGNPDNDGDGLCDNWETQGIDFNGDGPADLFLPDADPNRKNLYVEVDFLNQPECLVSPGGMLDVINAFANAPVPNPSGASGIILRIAIDDAIPPPENAAPLYAGTRPNGPEAPDDFDDLKYGLPSQACDGYFGTAAERAAPNCADKLGARALVYRYAMFANRFSLIEGGSVKDQGATSGVARTPGSGFLVTLGDWDAADRERAGGGKGVGPYNCVDCSGAVQAGTFMHELGHSLGRPHGGGDDEQHKPNYLSVMNYTFQMKSRVASRPLDYSRWALPPLDENSLNEIDGIDGQAPPADLAARWPQTAFTYFDSAAGDCKFKVAATVGDIDWNLNGTPFEIVAARINEEKSKCLTGSKTLLAGFDDWQSNPTAGQPLRYSFRSSSDFADDESSLRLVPEVEAELTVEEDRAIADSVDFDTDGVSNLHDNCMTVPNPNQEDADGDGMGDACDGCPNVFSATSDTDADGDGIGDACDPCPLVPNAPGDVTDTDSDGIIDVCDNCPGTPNPTQTDCNSDGVGDGCAMDCDGDGVPDDCDVDTEYAQTLPNDPVPGGNFGDRIVIDGDTMLVSAGRESGGRRAVYVFARDPNPPRPWTQQTVLSPGVEIEGTQYGYSIALSGDRAIIGDMLDYGPHGESNAGAAYVYHRQGSNWAQEARLTAHDAAEGEYFGVDVAIDGNTAMVKAMGNGMPVGGGGVYMFTRSGTNWIEQNKFVVSDAYAVDLNHYNASCMAIDGSTALVGNYMDAERYESVYVFFRNGLTWTPQAKLRAPYSIPFVAPLERWTQFGSSLDLEGKTALIGAYAEDGPVGNAQGAVHVYTRNTSTWTEDTVLRAPVPAANEYFGWSVALDNGRAVVSVLSQPNVIGVFQGVAHVFGLSDGEWSWRNTLTAGSALPYSSFGWSVALERSKALIAAVYDEPSGVQWQGAVYEFSFEDCDLNGVADACDRDCNTNGIADACEDDADADGVPDDCDLCPGLPDRDIATFIACLTGPEGAILLGCGCADATGDGDSDLEDFARFQRELSD